MQDLTCFHVLCYTSLLSLFDFLTLHSPCSFLFLLTSSIILSAFTLVSFPLSSALPFSSFLHPSSHPSIHPSFLISCSLLYFFPISSCPSTRPTFPLFSIILFVSTLVSFSLSSAFPFSFPHPSSHPSIHPSFLPSFLSLIHTVRGPHYAVPDPAQAPAGLHLSPPRQAMAGPHLHRRPTHVPHSALAHQDLQGVHCLPPYGKM